MSGRAKSLNARPWDTQCCFPAMKTKQWQCCERAGLRNKCLGYTFAAMGSAEKMSARFQFASDQSLLVYFEQPTKKGRAEARPPQSQITLQANENVRKLLRLLEL